MRRGVVAASIVGLALLASGCTVSVQSTATRLPSQLQLPAPSTTTTVPSATTSSQITIYFLKDGRLVPVPEYYPYDQSNPNRVLDAALFWLSIGPTAVQSACGITTGIPQSALALVSGPHGGTASVGVGVDFFNLQGVALEQATAQLVYTLTDASSAIRTIQLTFSSGKLESYVPPGIFVDRPVTRADYSSLAPSGAVSCPAPTGAVG